MRQSTDRAARTERYSTGISRPRRGFHLVVGGAAMCLLASTASGRQAGACSADIDGDAMVGITDLLVLLADWGTGEPDADLNGDGVVDVLDLLTMLEQWGPCTVEPTVRCPGDEWIPLDSDGSWTMPDLTDPTQAHLPYGIDLATWTGTVTVAQEPAAGTPFFGPQDVTLSLTFEDDAGHVANCLTTIELRDRTAPTLAISGVEHGARYEVGAELLPDAVAWDAVDDAVALNAWLDDEPYVFGTPIAQPGLHTFSVEAADDAGNVTTQDPILFDIAERPLHSAFAVTADLQCLDGPGGQPTIDATILLAAADFDVRDINLYSVRLWLEGEAGRPLHDRPLRIAGALDELGAYRFETVEAVYGGGYWTLRFRADLLDHLAWIEDGVVLPCPVTILITGTGDHTEPGEFDVRAEATAFIDPDPTGTLDEHGLLNEDPEEAAPEEPQWPACKWKHEIKKNPDTDSDAAAVDACAMGVQKASAHATSLGAHIDGEAEGEDHCIGDANASASTAGNATMRVFLEGAAACCVCEITTTLHPKFKAKASINEPAEIVAAGMIDIISTDGAAARAAGGVQLGHVAPLEVNLGASASTSGEASVEVSTTLTWNGTDSDSDTFAGNGVGSTSACEITISIVSTVKMKVKVDDSWDDWSSVGSGRLNGSTPGITVVAKCLATEGPCAGVTETFTYK